MVLAAAAGHVVLLAAGHVLVRLAVVARCSSLLLPLAAAARCCKSQLLVEAPQYCWSLLSFCSLVMFLVMLFFDVECNQSHLLLLIVLLHSMSCC
jgi:hypothetical protein